MTCLTMSAVATDAQSLRDLVIAAEISVTEFAERCGASRDAAHRWLRGDRSPYAHKLPAIARALGVDLGDVRAALEETARRRHAGEE